VGAVNHAGSTFGAKHSYLQPEQEKREREGRKEKEREGGGEREDGVL
jgi:hypothetical protein